ncbi:MAG: adenylyl-sulfate kinase [Pirellulaceae bacterium]|nr:adenylyl-sulfate kinase [Pirellulaceae bacterium]
MADKPEVTWHDAIVSREQRERLTGHQGCVVWFTGLSGSGKSTIANLVDQKLFQQGLHSFLLDGDNIRHGLNATADMLRAAGSASPDRFGLGFAAEDRQENIRRVGAVAQLFASAGLVTLVAFVSPYRRDRNAVRDVIEETLRPGDFVEVFVDTPLEVCEARDPKGLYQRARAGDLPGMTGIDAPYEAPDSAEIHLHTAETEADVLADQVLAHLAAAGKIPASI